MGGGRENLNVQTEADAGAMNAMALCVHEAKSLGSEAAATLPEPCTTLGEGERKC